MSDHIGDANEMVDNLTLTAPERIYLWSEHTEGRDETFMGGNWSTLTHDDHESVEYVRADLVPFHIGDAIKMVDNLTLTAPERIYLCVDDGNDRYGEFPTNFEDITWSTDQPVNQCVKYVRSDLVALTIQQVQQRMGDNLERWYPDYNQMRLCRMCFEKIFEEFLECEAAMDEGVGQECADMVIAIAGYCSQAGIDLQAEIEKKLAIVSARKDQSERDKERGIH